MNSNSIRKAFFDFFSNNGHIIIPSAPMVIKNDPTLMFTNAGMNQFKDIFLGDRKPASVKVANSQKCLRVSGKHNDLEEVGYDTYHHTMFEMLGNWSFGDYFKEKAIDLAWKFLTDKMNFDKERMYATYFEGDKSDNLDYDKEAYNNWKKFLPENQILKGNKKDNFWEMGSSGPCGPCSELHIDLRDENEIKKTAGQKLVNKDHPEVIEIWNLVFIEYNRKDNGELEKLPKKHIDTGMGFERLCRVKQNKKSNYDTDLFTPVINKIEEYSNIKYTTNKKTEIAMRVISDHLRAVSFSIADGQLPSNNGAGYVIRRILRRAIRYAYSYLNMNKAFIYKLVDDFTKQYREVYTELASQNTIIKDVIKQEEELFLKTLQKGIKLFDEYVKKTQNKTIDGEFAFKLYDTYGFPPDLTSLMASEINFKMDEESFKEELQKQKERSKSASEQTKTDWNVLIKDSIEEFVGYDNLETKVKITRYRELKTKKGKLYQLVFNLSPFYAESGGQVGDIGHIINDNEKINIIDTQKENNLIIHIVKELPKNPEAEFKAVVDSRKRQAAACNHSATHLLHKALKEILGDHVEQKGSLVSPDHLRFDFSHFQKLSNIEIKKIEARINHQIRNTIELTEKRNIPLTKAKEIGAVSLFGEKYGDTVRVIQFGESIELCGGTHVENTGEIGFFKITSESAIAAGIRRIEAVTAFEAEKLINKQFETIENIKSIITNKNIISGLENLIDENKKLKKEIEAFEKEKVAGLKKELINSAEEINGVKAIIKTVDVENAGIIKDILFQINGEINNFFIIIGAEIKGKANLSVMVSKNLIEKGLHAGNIIREAAKEIKGGGGGQAFFATAGGKDVNGIEGAINKAKDLILAKINN